MEFASRTHAAQHAFQGSRRGNRHRILHVRNYFAYCTELFLNTMSS
jgi:hypothetical protein